jgi:RNA polymerase sigma-70 factor (ECF subfamily)
MSSSATSSFPISSLSEVKTHSNHGHSETSVTPLDVGDEILIARLKEEDKEALSILFYRYARLVRRVCSRILGDDTEAEDLTQDVFLFIQRKCKIFDSSKGSLVSWIVQMAYHRAIERRRYLSTRHFYERVDIAETEGQIAKEWIVEDDYSPEVVFGRNGLKKVMDSLSKEQRETLRLHFFEGYTLSEISAKLDLTQGNVRHHFYRGLDKLRKEMFCRRQRDSGNLSRQTGI